MPRLRNLPAAEIRDRDEALAPSPGGHRPASLVCSGTLCADPGPGRGSDGSLLTTPDLRRGRLRGAAFSLMLRGSMRARAQQLALVTGLALSALFLWLTLKETNWTELGAAFAQAQLWMGVPVLLSLGGFYWLKATRWRRLLAPTTDIPARELLPSMMVGFAANNLLPMRVGELIRVYLLGQERGLSKTTVLGTVVLERLFDAIVILSFAAIALLGGGPLNADLRAAGLFLAGVTLAALVPAVLFVFHTSWFLRLIEPLLALLPVRLREKVHARIDALAGGFGTLRTARVLPAIAINSFVQWGLLALCIWLSIEAFDVSLPWLATLVVLVLVVAGITLPSSPGYVGAIEYCFLLGLKAYGVGASTALSIALFYHALTWAGATLAGVWYLRRYGVGWRALRREAAAD